MMKVYLDNSATTRIDPRVLKKMLPYFNNDYGNASSIHFMGQKNDLQIKDCKDKIKKIFKAPNHQVVFTGSATEANNFVIKGVMRANSSKGKHMLISAIEHPAVKNSAQDLKEQGYEIEVIPVDKEGLIDLEQLKKMIRPSTVLVSIIAVNNEIGTIQNLQKIGAVVKKSGAYFHTDAVQAIPYLKIDVREMNIDFLTISAHKFYGPQGVGLALINPQIKIKALISGGGQEDNLRGGTYNLPGIVGLTTALILAYQERALYLKRVKALRDYLWLKIKKNIPGVSLNGSWSRRTPNNLNIRFGQVEGEAILMDLSFKGIAVSTGSACSAQNLKSSSVLSAIGLKDEDLNSNIRFSLGKYNTKKEIDYTLKCLQGTIKRLRSFSPIK